MKQNPKIRIKDIAKMAGVSEGTIDRVLHNRGEVSEKSREKVQKVLDQLNYEPNIYARSLALKKQYRFVVFTPQRIAGNYWERISEGVDRAYKEFSNFHITIVQHFYNQFDRYSFTAESEQLLELKPDAVIIVPTFVEESKVFVQKLQALQTPYSFIDSMLESDNHFVGYYGQNSFQSGYVAAKLLLRDVPMQAKILLARTQRSGDAVSNQTQSRQNGFMEYVKQHHHQHKCSYMSAVLKDSEDDNHSNIEQLSALIRQYGAIDAAIIFNSKVYRLANYLEQIGTSHVRLIGYDLLDDNIKCLKHGSVDYLIAQRPLEQAYLAIRDLCKKLIFKQEVRQINYFPIDILMKENIEYYVETARL